MMTWRCMEDGGSEYVNIDATSVVEAAEAFACRRSDRDMCDGEVMRVIVLDPEADADDDADERYHIVDVSIGVTVTAHGVVMLVMP